MTKPYNTKYHQISNMNKSTNFQTVADIFYSTRISNSKHFYLDNHWIIFRVWYQIYFNFWQSHHQWNSKMYKNNITKITWKQLHTKFRRKFTWYMENWFSITYSSIVFWKFGLFVTFPSPNNVIENKQIKQWEVLNRKKFK